MTDCKPRCRAASAPREDRADDKLRAGAELRAPARLRRLSSFSSAGWIPHAKLATWGCLGLTRGGRHCRSKNWWRIPQTDTDAPAAASVDVSRSSDRWSWVDLMSNCPDEADEFARDGSDDDRCFLSAREHSSISTAEPDLRLPCNVEDFGRNSLVSLAHRLTNLGWHSVGPNTSPEQASRSRIRWSGVGSQPQASVS